MPSRRKPTAAQAAEAEARRTEILGNLSDGIDKLCDSAEWKRYLDVQSRFRHYSFANTMLIVTQRPDATQVTSFKKWKELDRSVKKGEHGIRIWAPRGAGKPETEATEEKSEEQPESRASATRFVLVPVFDVAQTEGAELPEPVKLLEGQDEHGVFGKLSKVAEDHGFTVQVTPEIEGHLGANGLCEFGAKRLTVAGNRSPKQRVKSLAHEVGHMLMHEPPASGQRDITRSQCELEAESTAYVVCKSLGLDTDDYSFGYVAGWTGGDKDKTQAAIKACGKRIAGAAKTICEGLEAQAETVTPEREPVAERQSEDREPELV